MKLKDLKKTTVTNVMFYYWLVIILWQTFRPVGNRSIVDIGVKVAALVFLLFYGVRHMNSRPSGNFGAFFAFFVISQVFTLLFDTRNIGMGQAINVVFIFFQIILFFMLLGDSQTSEKDLEIFSRLLIAIVIIMCVYNMIFHWDRFSKLFSGGGSAYGNECKSFLYSNHEFGIYISAGIIVLNWINMSGRRKLKFNFIFYVLFILNLISTYSRTAILGGLVATFIQIFFYSRKLFFWVFGIFIVFIIVSIFYEPLFDLIFNKVMKGSFSSGKVFDNGRRELYEEEINAYINSDFLKMLFGYGYEGVNQFGGHDAYLRILLTGGILMFINFVVVIIFGFYNAFICFKFNKSVGACLVGFIVFSLLYMLAQTPILFYSTMDSYFLTLITIVIPMYMKNFYVNRHQQYESFTD